MEFIKNKNRRLELALLSMSLSVLLFSCAKHNTSAFQKYPHLPEYYIEAWCRPSVVVAATDGMEARVQAPLAAPSSLSLLVSSDNGIPTTTPSDDTYQSATRAQNGETIVYQSRSMKLTVDLGKAEPNNKFEGVFTINGTDHAVSCRVLPPAESGS